MMLCVINRPKFKSLFNNNLLLQWAVDRVTELNSRTESVWFMNESFKYQVSFFFFYHLSYCMASDWLNTTSIVYFYLVFHDTNMIIYLFSHFRAWQHHSLSLYCQNWQTHSTKYFLCSRKKVLQVWNKIEILKLHTYNRQTYLSSYKKEQRRLLLLGFVLGHDLLCDWLDELLGRLQLSLFLSVWEGWERKMNEHSSWKREVKSP